MADTRITNLPALTEMSDDDLFVVVDNPSGEPTTKKITKANLFDSIPTEDTTYNATSPITIVGTTIAMPKATTSVNGYLDSTDWNTFNNKADSDSDTTYSADAPIILTGTAFSIPESSSTANGYISSSAYKLFYNKGDIGPQGSVGPQGTVGDTGPQGPQGTTGDQGIQGIQGTAGATGSQGPQGTAGIQGIQGTAAPTDFISLTDTPSDYGTAGYYVRTNGVGALYYGTTSGGSGTDTTYNVTAPITLVGTTIAITLADTDTNGYLSSTDWNTFNDGTEGPQGPQGTVGDTGAQGPQGTAGATGDTGAQGEQGTVGDTGGVGPQGTVGDTGEQGIQGTASDVPGPQGTVGDTGEQGEQGTAAPTVFTGLTDTPANYGTSGYYVRTNGTDGLYYGTTSGGSGSSPLTTKGDIYVYAGADARLPVAGTAGYILSVDSGEASGLKWIEADTSSIVVEQTFTATDSQTNFTCTSTPAAAWVWVAGLAQDPLTWSISGDDIVLSTGATTGDIVRIYYLTGGTAIIDAAITANTAKVTNATHTGDVTGDVSLTIADNKVGTTQLSATGTPSSTTYLRGDNAWTEPQFAEYKYGTSSFTDDDTSQTFTEAFCSTTAMVAVQITSGTAAGTWTVFGSSGSFRIDSTVAESTNIPFNYFITKQG